MNPGTLAPEAVLISALLGSLSETLSRAKYLLQGPGQLMRTKKDSQYTLSTRTHRHEWPMEYFLWWKTLTPTNPFKRIHFRNFRNGYHLSSPFESFPHFGILKFDQNVISSFYMMKWISSTFPLFKLKLFQTFNGFTTIRKCTLNYVSQIPLLKK